MEEKEKVKIDNGDKYVVYSETDLQVKIKVEDNEDEEEGVVGVKLEERSEMIDKFFSNSMFENTIVRDKNGKYICDICNKVFDKRSYLKQHAFFHTGIKKFICEICNASFSVKSNLTKHKFTHSELPFKCDICEKKFVANSLLERHKMSHFGIKPFECNLCQKKFTQKVHLVYHLYVHTGTDTRPFPCDECEKR